MSDRDKIDAELLTESLRDILSRAEQGDVLAAKNALLSLSQCLSNYIPAFMDAPLPVPDYVREYLSRCLYRMAMGEDAGVAMNLTRKKGGRPNKVGHFEKRLAADLIYQLIEQGLSVDSACEDAANFINEVIITDLRNSDKHKQGTHEWKQLYHAAWINFKSQWVSGDLLKKWYYELKGEQQNTQDGA